MNRDNKGSPTLPSSPSTSKTPTLSDLAKKNPSQLGDPVSLKAETSDTHPTENDLGAGPQPKKQMPAPSNPSALGDPVSLKAESKNDASPSGVQRASGSATGPGSLADAARKNPTALGDPVSLKAESKSDPPSKTRRSATGPGSLADAAKKNPTALGDPVSLKAEKSESSPTEDDRGAKSKL